MVNASGQSTLVGASALSAAAPDATTAVAAAMGIPIRQLCRTSASRSRRAAGNVASSAGTRTNCIGTTDANTNALKNKRRHPGPQTPNRPAATAVLGSAPVQRLRIGARR
jgi:hypothetical protein